MALETLIPTFRYPEETDALLSRLLPETHSPTAETRTQTQTLQRAVQEILATVHKNGDSALKHYTQTFDNLTSDASTALAVSESDYAWLAEHPLPTSLLAAIETAIQNITNFHEKQLPQTIEHTGVAGEKLSLRATPMEAVGIYVPGGHQGQTPLISTLMMNVIPAQLAGVNRLVVVSPPTASGTLAPALLYTLKRLKITEIYKVGGAQAIAALAYGTESIAPVHFISGPGNAYVTEAKRQVFGRVGIESLAGHSELVILSDGTVLPEHVASDLLSQAEHAGGELVCLITSDSKHALAVLKCVATLLPTLSRRTLIERSLTSRGACVLVADIAAAFPLINTLAPEHLELLIANPRTQLHHVNHAGAIFLGSWASEPIGDYIAGTNHVLPTGTTARFSSPLSVHHFIKYTNIIEYTETAFRKFAPHAEILAATETLTAHQSALTQRFLKKPHSTLLNPN